MHALRPSRRPRVNRIDRHTDVRVPRISQLSRIIAVQDALAGPNFDRIVIVTPQSEVVLRCNPDSDEIVVSRQQKGRKRWSGVVLLSGDFQVSWTWLLQNQQGYVDGFRLEARDGAESRVFEFVAMASAIEVREAFTNKVSRPPEATPPPTRTTRAQIPSRRRS